MSESPVQQVHSSEPELYFLKEFGNIQIQKISDKPLLESLFENNFEKFKNIAQRKVLYFSENDFRTSLELTKAIFAAIEIILENLPAQQENGFKKSIEKRVKKSNEFALSKGIMLLSMRYQGKEITSYKDVAAELNNKNELTPSGKVKWVSSTVERTCKRYMRLMKITEKDVPNFLKLQKTCSPNIIKHD